MRELLWYLKQVDWLSQLTAAETLQLEAAAIMRAVRKGDIVYFPHEPGQSALLVAQGRIKLKSLTPDGKEAILAFIEEGELFGELAILDDAPRNEFAEAVVDSEVIAIRVTDLREIMEQHPRVALGVARLVGLRRKRVENRLQNILFRSNRERLASLLLELLETHGTQVGAERAIDLKVSHQDLASLIGATRESVTLILGQLQLEKLIRVKRRQLIVLDARRLRTEAIGRISTLRRWHRERCRKIENATA